METRKKSLKRKAEKRTWNEMQEDKELSLKAMDEARVVALKYGGAWIRVYHPDGWRWKSIIYKNRFEAIKGFFKELMGWE